MICYPSVKIEIFSHVNEKNQEIFGENSKKKDKLGKLYETDQIFPLPNNTILNESLSALVMLGFVKRDAEKVVSKILQEQPQTTVEGVIKQALKRL